VCCVALRFLYYCPLLLTARISTDLENLEKSGNLILLREKSGKLGKFREAVVCLQCDVVCGMVWWYHNYDSHEINII